MRRMRSSDVLTSCLQDITVPVQLEAISKSCVISLATIQTLDPLS